MIAAAWVSRLHTGGYANVLMPAYAAFALLAGLTSGRLLDRRDRLVTLLLLLSALLLQLGAARLPPRRPDPDRRGPRRRDAVDSAAARAPRTRGRHPPSLVLDRGRQGSIRPGGGDRGRTSLRRVARGARDARVIARCARHLHVQAVVLDGPWDAQLFGPELRRDFRLQPALITPSPVYPLTDVRTAPMLVYLRIHPAPYDHAARHDRRGM